jgi:hypothetical protein
MKPAEQASVRKDYDQSLTAHQQWQTEQAKLAYEGRSAARIAARTSAAAATTETNRENFERQKEASAREWDLAKPRDRAETAAAFNTTPNESGVASGKEPTTYIAEAMGYVKADGTPDIDMVNKNFSRDEQPIIAQAMMNGYHYSPGTSAPMITKAITGALTDPSYIMHKTEISPDKVYGFPRYSISVEHKGTGTSTSFVLPVEDYNNLKALYNNRQQAAAKNAPAPAPAPAPTGAPAPAIPSAPYKPLVSGPMFRTPQWVPPEQMPPDQRAMYPELNQ